MPRNVEDIIAPHGNNKRSIRNIPVTIKKRSEATFIPKIKDVEEPVYETPVPKVKTHFKEPKVRRHRNFNWGGKGIWIGGLVALIFIAFAIMSMMRSATLAYTPKSNPLSFAKEQYSAYKTGGDGVLLFSVIKISDTKGMAVTASGEQQVSKKASGTIVVYNNASAAPQKLVANTRFQTQDGKIYKIPESISVPGKTASGPGSLETVVYADQPGEDYNIGLSDFTLPGLAGSPRFKTVYARSKTPMSGGFVGLQKTVSSDDQAKAQASIEASLMTQLVAEAKAQVPGDFVLYPNLSVVNYADLPQSSSTDKTVNINEEGDFYGVIFKRSDLANYIKNKKLDLPNGQNIEIPALDSLDLEWSGQAPQNLLNADSISFTMNGNATAVWMTDETALRNDLAGVSKDQLADILKNYPGIDSADAIIRPFWKTSFPVDPRQITIKEKSLK